MSENIHVWVRVRTSLSAEEHRLKNLTPKRNLIDNLVKNPT